MPFILFAGIFVAGIIGNEMITQKDVEEYGKKIQPKSGIVFPADTIFVNGHWVKYFAFLAQERPAGWSYISKEPFQLPENIKVRVKTSNTDTFKKLFSRMFETNITEATEYMEARWMTNGFVFSVQILETPDLYYLNLNSLVP